eukprot:scaffold11.g3923.t1
MAGASGQALAWPLAERGSVLLDVVLDKPVDEAFLLLYGGENELRKRFNEAAANKDYTTTGWVADPAALDAANGKPAGPPDLAALRPGLLRKSTYYSMWMGSKFRTDEVHRLTEASRGAAYEVHVTVTTTATYGDKFRPLLRHMLRAHGEGGAALEIRATLVFVQKPNGFIRGMIERGVKDGMAKNFATFKQTLRGFAEVTEGSAAAKPAAAVAAGAAAAAAEEGGAAAAAPTLLDALVGAECCRRLEPWAAFLHAQLGAVPALQGAVEPGALLAALALALLLLGLRFVVDVLRFVHHASQDPQDTIAVLTHYIFKARLFFVFCFVFCSVGLAVVACGSVVDVPDSTQEMVSACLLVYLVRVLITRIAAALPEPPPAAPAAPASPAAAESPAAAPGAASPEAARPPRSESEEQEQEGIKYEGYAEAIAGMRDVMVTSPSAESEGALKSLKSSFSDLGKQMQRALTGTARAPSGAAVGTALGAAGLAAGAAAGAIGLSPGAATAGAMGLVGPGAAGGAAPDRYLEPRHKRRHPRQQRQGSGAAGALPRATLSNRDGEGGAAPQGAAEDGEGGAAPAARSGAASPPQQEAGGGAGTSPPGGKSFTRRVLEAASITSGARTSSGSSAAGVTSPAAQPTSPRLDEQPLLPEAAASPPRRSATPGRRRGSSPGAPGGGGGGGGAEQASVTLSFPAHLPPELEQAAVVEEIFENQRLQPFRGWGHTWPGHFLPTDRVSRWTVREQLIPETGQIIIRGSSQVFSEVAPGLPEGWLWVEDSWALDISGLITSCVDGEGWSYGLDFGYVMYPFAPGSGKKKISDFVRRRRWIRTRVPAELYDQLGAAASAAESESASTAASAPGGEGAAAAADAGGGAAPQPERAAEPGRLEAAEGAAMAGGDAETGRAAPEVAPAPAAGEAADAGPAAAAAGSVAQGSAEGQAASESSSAAVKSVVDALVDRVAEEAAVASAVAAAAVAAAVAEADAAVRERSDSWSDRGSPEKLPSMISLASARPGEQLSVERSEPAQHCDLLTFSVSPPSSTAAATAAVASSQSQAKSPSPPPPAAEAPAVPAAAAGESRPPPGAAQAEAEAPAAAAAPPAAEESGSAAAAPAAAADGGHLDLGHLSLAGGASGRVRSAARGVKLQRSSAEGREARSDGSPTSAEG